MSGDRPIASLVCRAARRLLAEREAGVLGRESATRLARHLDRCAACRAESTVDRALSGELAALRVDYPFPVDVRRRVMTALAGRNPAPARAAGVPAVATDQLGLAAAVAVAATIVVALATGYSLGAIADGARQLWLLAGIAVDVAAPLIRAGAEIASLPLRAALGALSDVPLAVANASDRWLPVAIGLTALAYVAMGLAMARVIAREFVSAPAAGRHGRTA